MQGIINKMFDYKIEAAESEKESCSNPTRMETMDNCMDLSFQLFSDAIDEAYAVVARHMYDLRKILLVLMQLIMKPNVWIEKLIYFGKFQ